MIEQEDKVALTRRRAELVESLAAPLSTEDRVRIQGELSLVNAKIKAINTTTAAQLKAAADRRKVAGLTEFQANTARAIARVNGTPTPEPDAVDDDDAANDDDPGQTAAIDGWIDAVLLRHDVDFARDAKGAVMLTSDPSRPHVPQKLAAAIELLVAGIYAAARGQELPDLPIARTEGRYVPTPKPKKTAPKAKSKKR